MSVRFEQVKSDALQLDRDERMILGQKLLISAISQEETEQEKAWYDEAERRLADYEAGRMKVHNGPEAIDRLIAGIKNR
ncbi:MAG: addiction module protein [Victivallales bacterium]|nr:addiction module protein [Victivallales bacterium]